MLIQTVTGTIDSSKLGYTLMHEHTVTCCDWSMRMCLKNQFCNDNRLLEMAVTQLKKARAAGIDTIVDGTPINLGRDKKMMGTTEFAANECVTVIGPQSSMEGIRILSPIRRYTQVELMRGDCRRLGITAPIVDSGNLKSAGSGAARKLYSGNPF